MTDAHNIRLELVRLTQQLIVDGNKVVQAFATRHGLHPTDVEALALVRVAQDRGKPLTAGALATDLGLTSGAITALVDRLERTGHISRVRDNADRRKVFLHYSIAGLALADEFFVPLLERSVGSLDEFTDEELAIAHRFLTVTGVAMTTHRGSLVGHSSSPTTPN
ncbi:MarR family winged helix-turn-helix transcriptional regulator [Nocardioides aurantiacus]|uniref:DNA-binding MarR family transcriptional regulator n=1 Tax=Nocardioides aurantiacus TaxID=86796 RepID=A0A3N2CU05_9ACTN|nr:MarR family transcriptional regulator [Nocardioides aurantiacus]ROR91005.1 DNA-binding MarR family transcriptional regulator [Nocardioides aurantiacus]